MPQNTKKIIDILEDFAPLELQEEWDNSGWQINLGNSTSSKILLTTTITQKTISYAKEKNCDLIISHHPLIFSPIKKIVNPIIISAIKNNIQIYCLHTNFDKTKDGTTEIITKKFGFNTFEKLNDFTTFVNLEKEISLEELILKTKLIFNIEKLKIFNFKENKKIKKIAFCAGSGGDFINYAEKNNIDLFITADLKYHQTQEVKENLCIFDVGHLESEKICLNKIKNLLENEDIEIFIEDEKSNFKIL